MKKIDVFEAEADMAQVRALSVFDHNTPGAVMLIIKRLEPFVSERTGKKYPQAIVDFYVQDSVKLAPGIPVAGETLKARGIAELIVQEILQEKKRTTKYKYPPKGYFWGSYRCIIKPI